MLDAIKRFFIGNPPEPDDNRIYYQPEAPAQYGGILSWPQLVKGDLWVAHPDSLDTYYWDGDQWVLGTDPLVDA